MNRPRGGAKFLMLEVVSSLWNPKGLIVLSYSNRLPRWTSALNRATPLAAMQPLGIRIIFGTPLGILAALAIGALPGTALPTATVLSSAPFTGIDDWPARFVRVAMRDAEKLRHRAKQLLLLAQKARDDAEAGDAGESRLMVRNERAGHPSTRLAAVIY